MRRRRWREVRMVLGDRGRIVGKRGLSCKVGKERFSEGGEEADIWRELGTEEKRVW